MLRRPDRALSKSHPVKPDSLVEGDRTKSASRCKPEKGRGALEHRWRSAESRNNLAKRGAEGNDLPDRNEPCNTANADTHSSMNSTSLADSHHTTRREFLKTSGTALAGAALAGAMARPGYAAENNTIKIALVGCGGRGTGAAAQALSTQGPTKLWAMADVFEQRAQSSLANLKARP